MAVAKYNLPYYNGRGISNNTPNARPLNTDIYEYIGTIISVNPVTFTVNVASEQGNIDMDILILNQGFSAIERSQSWIHSLRGKKVVVKNIRGIKFILGTLPSNIEISDTTTDTLPFIENETGGDTEAAYKASLLNNVNIGRKDYLDGDIVMTTTDNTSLSLFKGGLSNWKVSNLTQIILHKMKSLIRMVTRNFELFTDFGTIQISNNEDKTTLKIEGGASFKKETLPGTDKYSVTVEMGSIEDDDKQRLKISVKDPEQDSNKVDVMIGIDGIIKIECSEKAEIRSTKEISLSSDKDLSISSSQGLTLNAVKNIDIISKGGINIQSTAQGTNIKSDGIVGIKGQLITLN